MMPPMLPDGFWRSGQKAVAREAILLYEAGHYEEALPRLEALAAEDADFAEVARFPIAASRRVIGAKPTTDDFHRAAQQQTAGRTPEAVLKQNWNWTATAMTAWTRA